MLSVCFVIPKESQLSFKLNIYFSLIKFLNTILSFRRNLNLVLNGILILSNKFLNTILSFRRNLSSLDSYGMTYFVVT